MRNISFALTTEQVRNQTKTVTRRLGWLDLKRGELLHAVEKSQGLKKGEHPKGLAIIRVVDVRRQKLTAENLSQTERAREGFPRMTAKEFIAFFCESHGCKPGDKVTRIEFEYFTEGEMNDE